MARSSRSSSISSESSANGEEGSYKRLKLGETNMEFASSSSSNSDKQKQQSSPSSNSSQNNSKTQAAFVNKLYKMLEDPHTVELISWSASGDLFSVSNPTAFSKTILPQYFKHNNWQSFVRQLNMYGFHKVNDLIHSNLTNENQTWEFKHPYFRKGQVWNLQHIKRKNAKTQQQILFQQQQRQQAREQIQSQYILHTKLEEAAQSTDTSEEDKQNTSLLNHIVKIEDQLVTVSKTCELLFKEMINLRVIVSKQQDAMQDLVDVVSSSQSNNTCVCGNTLNSNNNNDNTNNQDLQNAESLRLQVSKLKNRSANGGNNNNNNNRESLSDSSISSNNSHLPNWSPVAAMRNDNSSSVNSTPSPNQGSSFNSSSPAIDSKRTQRLPSIDYMQQTSKSNSNNSSSSGGNEDEHNKNSNNNELEMLRPMSSYFNNENDSNTNGKGNQSMYQNKTSSSPSRNDSNNDNRNKQNEENNDRSSTSFMTLGKRSHILNPVQLEKKDGKRPAKRKTIKSVRENEGEHKNVKQEEHHT